MNPEDQDAAAKAWLENDQMSDADREVALAALVSYWKAYYLAKIMADQSAPGA